MTVAENIGFHLKIKKRPKAEIKQRVLEAAKLLDLEPYLDRKPARLSGGQRQRVAMGRAIVRQPQVFLMDEPLSNLDAKLRVATRTQIASLQRRLGVTTVYVTHDQVEAMTMGDRVCVLHKGQLQQCDTPQVLYEHPDNIFVAAFIGSPAMNLYEAALSPTGDEVKVGSQRLSLPQSVVQARPGLAAFRDRNLIIGLRPENLADASVSAPAGPGSTLEADVELVEALGNELQVHFLIEASRARSADTDLATGTAELGGVPALAAEGSKSEGVARIGPRSTLKAGSRAIFAVETESLHFFDPETGKAIWN